MERLRRRTERGAVIVEGAIVAAAILVPLMLGIFKYGNLFWHQQPVGLLQSDQIPQGSVAGTYTCKELSDRIKSLLSANTQALATQLGIPASSIQTVVNIVPSASVGAQVGVTFTIPSTVTVNQTAGPVTASGSASGPAGTINTINRFDQYLTNVQVSTQSC